MIYEEVTVKHRHWIAGVVLLTLIACSKSPAPESAEPSNQPSGSNVVTNEYPAQLLGKYTDRPCAEASTIQKAADLWPGFEIKKFERSEMALLCAATSVREESGGFQIAETCLVRQANQQALRNARYQLAGEALTVTVDGKATKFSRCL